MQSKKMSLDFNKVASPNHLAKGVVAGVLMFAFTSSLPAYFATIVVVHLASCAFSAFRKKPGEPNPSV